MEIVFFRRGYTGEQGCVRNMAVKVRGSGKADRVTMLTARMDKIGLMVLFP